MLIIGYCYGIRSERRLCEEVHLNRRQQLGAHLDATRADDPLNSPGTIEVHASP